MNQQKRRHDVSGGLIQESSEEGNSERNYFHFFKEMGRFFLFVMYLIRHLRFLCVWGCSDRTHNCCDLVIWSQTLKVLTILDLCYLYVPYMYSEWYIQILNSEHKNQKSGVQDPNPDPAISRIFGLVVSGSRIIFPYPDPPFARTCTVQTTEDYITLSWLCKAAYYLVWFEAQYVWKYEAEKIWAFWLSMNFVKAVKLTIS